MDEIGILIHAKANLDEVDRAAQKLENFSNLNQKAANKIRGLVEASQSTAGTDINMLGNKIAELQKKVQGGDLSQTERKQARQKINDYKEQLRELRSLQRAKADDYGSMEMEARLHLEQLKNKRSLTRAEKEHIKVIEEGLRYLEKYNKSKLELDALHLENIQKDLKNQEEAAKESGFAGFAGFGKYARRIGGVIIGGSIIAVATQMMKKWSELDTQITKTSASLDNLSKSGVVGITEIGNALGYTKEQALAFYDIWQSITGSFSIAGSLQFGNLLQWGRTMGIGESGLQLRELQRYGGEAVKPGVGNVFLSQFTGMARLQNMREGRTVEFIQTAVNLVKTMEKTFYRVESGDIFRNIMLPAIVFGGEDRGRGERGFDYMQRLNESLRGGSDLMNVILYRTLGAPKSFSEMWAQKQLREQGAFARNPETGLPLIIDILKTQTALYGGKKYEELLNIKRTDYHLMDEQNRAKLDRDIAEIEARIAMYTKAAMPGLSSIEIAQMQRMQKELSAGTWKMEIGKITPDLMKKLMEEGFNFEKYNIDNEQRVRLTNIGFENLAVLMDKFPALYEKWQTGEAISKGERWKIAIENMQFSIGGTFGPTLIGLLTGMARAVDSIASRFAKKTGYVSIGSTIDEIDKEYQLSMKKAAMVQFPEISQSKLDRLRKEYEMALNKKPGEEGYQTEKWHKETGEKIREMELRLEDPIYMELHKIANKYRENNKKEELQEIAAERETSDKLTLPKEKQDKEVDNLNNLKNYYISQISRKREELQELTAEYESSTPGFKKSLLYAKKDILEEDIRGLSQAIRETSDKLTLPKEKQDKEVDMSNADRELIQSAREFKADKLIISNLPDFWRSYTPPTAPTNIKITIDRQGEIRGIEHKTDEVNIRTSLPTDNYD